MHVLLPHCLLNIISLKQVSSRFHCPASHTNTHTHSYTHKLTHVHCTKNCNSELQAFTKAPTFKNILFSPLSRTNPTKHQNQDNPRILHSSKTISWFPWRVPYPILVRTLFRHHHLNYYIIFLLQHAPCNHSNTSNCSRNQLQAHPKSHHFLFCFCPLAYVFLCLQKLFYFSVLQNKIIL